MSSSRPSRSSRVTCAQVRCTSPTGARGPAGTLCRASSARTAAEGCRDGGERVFPSSVLVLCSSLRHPSPPSDPAHLCVVGCVFGCVCFDVSSDPTTPASQPRWGAEPDRTSVSSVRLPPVLHLHPSFSRPCSAMPPLSSNLIFFPRFVFVFAPSVRGLRGRFVTVSLTSGSGWTVEPRPGRLS